MKTLEKLLYLCVERYKTKGLFFIMGTTLNIVNNLIVVNLDKIDTISDTFIDGDKQTIVFLISHLGGYKINYTDKTIHLYLTLKELHNYEVDFKRGSDRVIIQNNFDNAVAILTGSHTKKKDSELKFGKRSREY